MTLTGSVGFYKASAREAEVVTPLKSLVKPMGLTGTVVFSTVGRPFFGFDIFSVEIPSTFGAHTTVELVERRITDGTSVNFNGYFVDERGTVVFISERTGSALVYVSRPGGLAPEPLPSIDESFFHDRPVMKNGRLYLVSNHERPEELPNCWTAVYSTSLADGNTNFRRLTPFGVADFSPAVSESGEFVAVASYGYDRWSTSDYTDHKTDIVVFKESEPTRRTIICRKGGWPTWFGDSTIFFHRQGDDGWWSIYRVDLPENFQDLGDVLEARRVTPPGVHAFTPSVSHDGKRIAVATRRAGCKHRHIEIFDVETESLHRVTETINPSINHYNPFFSPESGLLGYHRFRGVSDSGERTMVPHLEQVKSPEKNLRLLRINGNCALFSPDGRFIVFNPDFDTGFDRNSGIRIIKTDGSKRWTVLKDRIVFSTAWSPSEKGVIFTSAGMVFDSIKSSVQIARIEFNEADLTDDRDEVPAVVKILTREETGNNAFPSVSPDGKYVVFRSGRSGHKNLYIMDAVDGEFHDGGVRQLTDGAWTDTMPSWSADGELIVFSSNRQNTADAESYAIYLIRPDGTGLRRVYVAGPEGSAKADNEKINHVVFSADGEWLIFTANLAGVSAESVSMPQLFQPFGDIFACKIDGTHLMRLTWTAFENGTPAFHPIGENDVGGVVPWAADFDEVEGQFEELKWLQHI